VGGAAVTAWADLTSRRLAGWDRNVPVVLPVGAVEQHGPHLPLSTDMAVAEHFRRELDRRLGDEVLTLPTIATGYSGIHSGFPGTLSVRHSTLLDELVDTRPHLSAIATSLGDCGRIRAAIFEL
jgi:creatinine amidohydrolase